jgi:hypothetical protein
LHLQSWRDTVLALKRARAEARAVLGTSNRKTSRVSVGH